MKARRPRRHVRVPVRDLIAPERLRALGHAPTPSELGALLPRGWMVDDDGLHARRDLRLFFREGWLLALCLAAFGTAGAVFVLGAVPRGWAGAGRILLLLGAVALAGGVAAPLVTRALRKR